MAIRIVHTSDWHAGRLWKNLRRLDELEVVLCNLAEFVAKESVDLLLVSGDIFDNAAPVADAERLVFRFLRSMGEAAVKSIIIAGNHDSPGRLQAWGSLAELAGVQVIARPQRADRGGVIRFENRNGERAVIAAMPFASTRDLVSAATLAEDDTVARQRYADGVRRMVEQLCSHFDQDAVNLLVAHTHVDGAVLSGSEREVHVGEQWAATAQALPPHAHYVALGHIHRPQALPAAPSPTQYAGSPMQLDFGEEGEEKSFVVIDAEARRPATIRRVPYKGARPLCTVRANLPELEARVAELREAGWLRVTVPLDVPDPELNTKVRRLLPNAVGGVRVELPETLPTETSRPPAGSRPIELFRSYFRGRHGRDPEDVLLNAFEAVMAEAGDIQ